MATTLKITALPALTTPNALDVLAVVDITDTSEAASGTTKKIELQNLFTGLIMEPASLTFDGVSYMTHYVEGTWTPTVTGLTVVGTPTYTGTYVRVGKLVFCTLVIGATTSTASTAATSKVTGVPVTQGSAPSTCSAVDNGTAASYGVGIVSSSTVFLPSWSATPANVNVSFFYITT